MRSSAILSSIVAISARRPSVITEARGSKEAPIFRGTSCLAALNRETAFESSAICRRALDGSLAIFGSCLPFSAWTMLTASFRSLQYRAALGAICDCELGVSWGSDAPPAGRPIERCALEHALSTLAQRNNVASHTFLSRMRSTPAVGSRKNDGGPARTARSSVVLRPYGKA